MLSRLRGPVPLILVAMLLSACRGTGAQATITTTPDSAPSAVAASPRHTVFGQSASGRPLDAYSLGPAKAAHRILVVGVIHGDEAAGLPIVRQLLDHAHPGPTFELVVVPDLNPDGVARRTRQNARRVDLNRNFPLRWQRSGRPGDQQYGGTAALSEPESRAMTNLIRQVRPTVTVWFHQPVGVVDESGGSVAIERRFAMLLGVPLKRLTRYPGSAASWENSTMAGTTAFVVELPRHVSNELRNRALHALRDLIVR